MEKYLEKLLSKYSFTNNYNVLHKQYSFTDNEPLIIPCRQGICGFCVYITDEKGNMIQPQKDTHNKDTMKIDIYQGNIPFFHNRPLDYYNRRNKYERLKKAKYENVLKLLPLGYYFYLSMALSLYGKNPDLADNVKLRIEMSQNNEKKYYVNIYEFTFRK